MKVIRIMTVIIILLLLQGLSAYSQDNNVKPRISVKKLTVSDPDNIQLQVISDRVTDNTELVLKFMNEYELDSSSDLSGVTENSMLDYCNSNNVDNIVYGKTYVGNDNSFLIEMSVYSREKEQTALTRIGKAESALDIFDAADKLTASIIEEFSGVHIAFGKIHLTGTGVDGSFLPFIDGQPFPQGSSTIENLLIGKRTVELRQQRMLEEIVIFTEEVIVKENSITEITFEIPHLLPAESEVINSHDKIITKNWDKLKRKEKVIRAFNELDTILTNTPWNLSLADLKAEYIVKRAEYEANLVELSKKGKREFIIGATMGVNISAITKRSYDDESKSDSQYDPIDDNDWNDQSSPAPSFGVNIQYQLYNNLYIQTELNYKEIFYSEYDDMDNYIKILEIPVLFKLTKQFDNHRFSMYMGPAFFQVQDAGGIFSTSYSNPVFTSLDQRESDIEMIMGLEYGYKKDRHILTAGLRYTSMNILEYSFFDVDDNQDYSQMLNSSSYELILGYGYNLGGNGKIATEENRDKWLFPGEAGLIFMLSENEDNTQIIYGAGFLRRLTENLYGGIRGFGFSQGGAPMLSVAYTKDPDKIIHNYSLVVFPIMDTLVGAFEYNIGINRYSIGVLAGGPLESLTDLGIGFAFGYFF